MNLQNKYTNPPDKIRKHHVNISLKDSFSELYKNAWSIPAVELVAWLAMCYRYGSIDKARRFIGLSQNGGYYRLYELEKRLGYPVWCRQQRPFKLTDKGKELVNRYERN